MKVHDACHESVRFEVVDAKQRDIVCARDLFGEFYTDSEKCARPRAGCEESG